MDLKITVKAIKGTCPVYKLGDHFVLQDGYRLVSDIPVCMHALSSLMPHYNAFRFADPGRWGAAGKDQRDKLYFQCLDPFEFTGGGTVVFEVSRVNQQKSASESEVRK
ncbi:MAG: TIGR04076 family protein [candidate division KSB1 bacterium]|nr:TIGR04076 family protein [candidate division KSB1 bacterium]MDQ7065831.1 TIGR04076 family protein [candidate division KSB1 bacterium]